MTNHLGSQEIPNKIVNKYLTDTCKPMVIVVKPSRTLWDFPGTDSSIPVSIFSYDFNFIYLILAVLGLHCCSGFSLIVVSRLVVHGFIMAVASFGSCSMRAQQLWLTGSRALEHMFSSCGTWVQLLPCAHRHVGYQLHIGMWDLPGPGI